MEDELIRLRKEKGEAWKASRFETEGLMVLDDKEIVEVKKEWRRKKIEEEQRKLDEEGVVLVDDPADEEEPVAPTEEDMSTEDEEDRDATDNLVEQMLLQQSVTENAACERVRDSDIFGRGKPRLLHPREPVVKRPRPPNLPRSFRIVAPFPGPWSPWNSESEEEGGSEEGEEESGSEEEGEEEAGPTEAGPTN